MANMTPIKPNREMFLLDGPAYERTYGGPDIGQPQFIPLPTLVTANGSVVTQWQLDPNDLEMLKSGVPITLELQTGGSCPPMRLVVGGLDLREQP
jgi:hypothetical protein